MRLDSQCSNKGVLPVVSDIQFQTYKWSFGHFVDQASQDQQTPYTTNHRHETCNSETDAQDISGWRLQEQVNVPSDITFDRYTWGTGTVLQPGQLFALCNSQAGDFLLQQCNETAGLGINGNDAVLLYSQDGDIMVRPRPQLC